jgi:hypothetical protein
MDKWRATEFIYQHRFTPLPARDAGFFIFDNLTVKVRRAAE